MQHKPGFFKRHRKVAIVLFTTIATLTAVAAAQWLTTGDGFGRSKSTHTVALTITPTDANAPDLFPNQDGAIAFDITNPNPGDIQVTGISQTGDAQDSTSHVVMPECAITINSGALGAAVNGSVIPAGGTVHFNVAGGVHMGDATNNCQDRSFDVPLHVDGTTP